PDPSYTQDQLQGFLEVVDQLSAAGRSFRLRHAANSAAILDFPETHLDMVRAGIALYGTTACLAPRGPSLRPAVALRGRIARVVDVPAGDGVGYGQTWRAARASRVGVVSAGYADGINRQLSNRGTTMVCEREAPIVGRISMDFTTVDLTDVQS